MFLTIVKGIPMSVTALMCCKMERQKLRRIRNAQWLALAMLREYSPNEWPDIVEVFHVGMHVVQQTVFPFIHP